ncbi:Methyltransferase domain protein [uncultured delta proteobacterium]|uniref:Methyltransferase domain protein n=1 Tax=uncultured delta proteobacterium TaxID=34034 RepID=A0A212IUU0_9DELT|nr:Methyltransferase domain protein [uncultured delta proteobacterium]
MPPDSYGSAARWYGWTASRALRPAHERLAALCAARKFSRVVDIGCGTGHLAAMLAARGVAVTGVDASPAMLARAARIPWREPAPLFVLGGVPLPFPPRSFDAAVLSLVLHESDDEPETLLAEVLRVAPVCLVLEWRMPERNLDLPGQILVHAIERLAGKRHYARFRNFVRGGYLHGAAHRAKARVADEEPLMGGTMVLAEVIANSS